MKAFSTVVALTLCICVTLYSICPQTVKCVSAKYVTSTRTLTCQLNAVSMSYIVEFVGNPGFKRNDTLVIQIMGKDVRVVKHNRRRIAVDGFLRRVE